MKDLEGSSPIQWLQAWSKQHKGQGGEKKQKNAQSRERGRQVSHIGP